MEFSCGSLMSAGGILSTSTKANKLHGWSMKKVHAPAGGEVIFVSYCGSMNAIGAHSKPELFGYSGDDKHDLSLQNSI